jgi:hypothetical protein
VRHALSAMNKHTSQGVPPLLPSAVPPDSRTVTVSKRHADRP